VDARALPFLGLGLSSNLDPAVEPDPWALHAAEPGLFDLVEYSAPLSLEVAEREAGLFGTLMASRARLPGPVPRHGGRPARRHRTGGESGAHR